MSKLARLKTFATAMPDLFALSGWDGYLSTTGWFLSRARRTAVDGTGQPIPWMTYPGLAFVTGRLRKDMAVFEFGCGASTLWWARMVRTVISCEHDLQWFERTRSIAPSNVQLIHAPVEDQQYSREILKHRNAFDVVVIDGRDRVSCARNSLSALKSDGVVLWDNSDREQYRPGYEFLAAQGFRRIDFTGFGPINVYSWSTSIFYRTENCFGV